MISFVTGHLRETGESTVVVDVGGVGLEIVVGNGVISSLPGPGEEITLMTRLIVREDSFTLYGFLDRESRALFDLLIEVPSVGPRTAMSVISSLGAEKFLEIVVSGDIKLLTAVPGIGKKTAERILLEMGDRLKNFEGFRDGGKRTAIPVRTGNVSINEKGQKKPMEEAREALLSLGFSTFEVLELLKKVDHEQSVEKIVEQALKSMRR